MKNEGKKGAEKGNAQLKIKVGSLWGGSKGKREQTKSGRGPGREVDLLQSDPKKRGRLGKLKKKKSWKTPRRRKKNTSSLPDTPGGARNKSRARGGGKEKAPKGKRKEGFNRWKKGKGERERKSQTTYQL